VPDSSMAKAAAEMLSNPRQTRRLLSLLFVPWFLLGETTFDAKYRVHKSAHVLLGSCGHAQQRVRGGSEFMRRVANRGE